VIETTTGYLHQSGWIMAPLIVVSVAMWTLILERLIALRRYTHRDVDLPLALAAARGEIMPPRSGGIRAALVRTFVAQRSGHVSLDREILAQGCESLDRELEQRLEAITVLVVVAPLLGLLGTVLGMVQTFNVLANFGTGNARALAGGVSVALITTQTGLLIALPGLLFSGQLRDRFQQLRVRLAETAQLLDRDLEQRAQREDVS